MERTLILLKPDAVRRGLLGQIIARFEAKGWTIVAMKQIKATIPQATAHYTQHGQERFFNHLVHFLCSGPLVAICLEGESIIALSRRMIGHYNPEECLPGTIRGDWATSPMENLVHGSDSLEAAQRELMLWFSHSELS